LEGPAQQWYFRLERNRGMPTWPQFIDFVNHIDALTLRWAAIRSASWRISVAWDR